MSNIIILIVGCLGLWVSGFAWGYIYRERAQERGFQRDPASAESPTGPRPTYTGKGLDS